MARGINCCQGCDLFGRGYDLLSSGDGLLGRDIRQWYDLLSTSSDLLGEAFHDLLDRDCDALHRGYELA